MVEFCMAGSVALEHAEKANCNHIHCSKSKQISITDNIAKPEKKKKNLQKLKTLQDSRPQIP